MLPPWDDTPITTWGFEGTTGAVSGAIEGTATVARTVCEVSGGMSPVGRSVIC